MLLILAYQTYLYSLAFPFSIFQESPNDNNYWSDEATNGQFYIFSSKLDTLIQNWQFNPWRYRIFDYVYFKNLQYEMKTITSWRFCAIQIRGSNMNTCTPCRFMDFARSGWYIGECMVSIRNINSNIKLST